MKKILKLALHETAPWYKLLLGFLSICYTVGALLNDSEDFGNIGTTFVLIGCYIILGTVVMCANGNADLKLLKTLPLTNGNITDIFALSAYMGVPLMSLGISVWHIIFGKAYMIPYYICGLTVCAAFGTVMIPLLATDVSVHGAGNKINVRSFVLSLLMMFGSAAIGTVLCFKGYKQGCLAAEDVPLLLGIFAACIVLSLAVTAVYRRKIKYSTVK
ncbi:MAG: hypothetical protein NC395_03835 [Prevotella sp.]|nr:hypothetical protein [Prevotella sp.]